MAQFPSSHSYGQSCGNNAAFVIINGRRVPVGAGLSGRDLETMAGGAGRRTTVISDGHTRILDANKFYTSSDLKDRQGRPVKISSIPDRTKGASLYNGRRDDYSRAIITEQVMDVARNYVRGNVDFDVDNADWMVIPKFRLPPQWNLDSAPLMIVFPREYPTTPPIGFYLPDTLKSPNGHFFGTVYHGAAKAPTLEGWNWYCCTVNAGAWRSFPAHFSGEWRKGDNLWTYITLINEVLGSPIDAD